jgi:hypothetical protein
VGNTTVACFQNDSSHVQQGRLLHVGARTACCQTGCRTESKKFDLVMHVDATAQSLPVFFPSCHRRLHTEIYCKSTDDGVFCQCFTLRVRRSSNLLQEHRRPSSVSVFFLCWIVQVLCLSMWHALELHSHSIPQFRRSSNLNLQALLKTKYGGDCHKWILSPLNGALHTR